MLEIWGRTHDHIPRKDLSSKKEVQISYFLVEQVAPMRKSHHLEAHDDILASKAPPEAWVAMSLANNLTRLTMI